MENQLKDMKTNVSSVTFGSKKIFKSQYKINTFKNDHQLWLKKWKQSRNNQMTISGRKDSSSGNLFLDTIARTRSFISKHPQVS
jgi:hypothetical protein